MCGAGYRAYGAKDRLCTGFLDCASGQRSGGGRPLDLGDGYSVHARYLFDGEQVTTDV
ncbi:hypothetical protein GGC64_004218 [Mycobacterium sp. OAS707]|nr:hypothetical protein [Mycobacterium sp. OAS707]